MKTTDMIRASHMVGGNFRLTALLQRRVTELIRGAPPLIEFDNPRDFIEIALMEVLDGKIDLVFDEEVPEQDEISEEGDQVVDL